MKRFLSVALMTVMMVMTLALPMSAFADTEGSTAGDQSITEDQDSTAESGDQGSDVDTEKTGLQVIDGETYYFNEDGTPIEEGIHKCSDGKYRCGIDSTGRIALGAYKVNGKWYYFDEETGARATKKGFAGDGKYYCVSTSGRLATGWTAVGKRAYYFSTKNAKRVYNKKIKYLKIGRKGYLGEAYARAIRLMDKRGWKLRTAYNYSKGLKYKNRWMRRDTAEEYAVYGFKHHYGNCYVMASTFYVQAKLLGYNVHQVKGYVGRWPHSWTTIRQSGRTYVYDPNFENETGRNGWKIWYGKKGTWRYSHKHNMN
jgi:YHS domain-containing protein